MDNEIIDELKLDKNNIIFNNKKPNGKNSFLKRYCLFLSKPKWYKSGKIGHCANFNEDVTLPICRSCDCRQMILEKEK